MRHSVIGCLAFALFAFPVQAEVADGSYAVHLRTQAGEALPVARLSVSGGAYALEWNENLFEDAFLSMRPFRCMEGPERTLCRVPYPYENRRQVTAEELTDLEYDLLFLWKRSGDYGINMWNGIYYDLSISDDGLRGDLQEMDMGLLAVPPAAGNLRPVQPQHLEPGDPDSHWLPELVITPVTK